jgi:clan AA aspartic protease
MIIGSVNSRLEATLPLQVLGPNRQQQITAVIDTGYNGELSLPMAVITALSLPPLAPGRVRLADASRRILRRYRAEVIWDGQRRTVRVLCVEGDPLIGTALLSGYRMEADFVAGGQVTLQPLP